jgi:rhodanese-related sulfurtransferase
MSEGRIGREELRALVEGDADLVLLEALGPMYYEDGHLPGARNLPPKRLDELAPELIGDRRRPVVVYCASVTCANSHEAAARLRALGYADVRVYPGGKADWAEAGLPLERGAVAVS